ncbi:tail completion protein gp17 [Pandoraea soli]
MNHDAVLASVLQAAPALSGTPIRPDVADQSDAAPYIVYSEIALQEGAYTLMGESTLVPARYQIDVYATTRAQANTLAQAVADAVAAAFSGVLLNRQSLFEPDTRLRRTLLDLSIWFDNI